MYNEGVKLHKGQLKTVLVVIPLLVSAFIIFEFALNVQNQVHIAEIEEIVPDVRAVAKDWDGGGDGESWDDPANWNPDGIPQPGDSVTIDTSTTVYLPSRVTEQSMFAHWKLDENAANTTVNDSFASFTGTASTNTSNMSVAGKLGNAMDFDGARDVKFGNLNPVTTGNVSEVAIAAWVMFDDLTGHRPIFKDGGNVRGWEFGIYNGELHVAVENNDTHRAVGYPVSNLQTGVWTHVAAVLDGPNGDIFIYVDGNLVASDTNLTAFTDYEGSNNTVVGSSYFQSPSDDSATTAFFDGRIDDVRVYGTVINSNFISSLYLNGAGQEATFPKPQNHVINTLTLGNAGGTTSPTLEFAYDAQPANDDFEITAGDLVVHPNTIITHTAGTLNIAGRIGINITSGNAIVDGSIDTTGKGYTFDRGPGAGTCIGGACGGGGYGGEGGDGGGFPGTTRGTAYGCSAGVCNTANVGVEMENPLNLGSGGGSEFGSGGVGGGSVKLTVSGALTNNGSIKSDGISGISGHDRGGGAGGSIHVTTNGGINGSGIFSAVGADGTGNGGGGGGGRIYIQFGNVGDFPLGDDTRVDVYGGAGGPAIYPKFGGSGTYVRTHSSWADPIFVVDNNDRFETNNDLGIGRTPINFNFPTRILTIRNGGNIDLRPGGGLSHTHGFSWDDFGRLTDNGGAFSELTSGTLTVPQNAKLFANTARAYTTGTVDGTVTTSNNYSSEQYKLSQTYDSLTISATGSIDVSGRGYYQDFGPGAGGCAGAACSGGGYGGEGGKGGDFFTTVASGGGAYGLTDIVSEISNPTSIGSGGGSEFGDGGQGGGAISLNVTNRITIDGTVKADGETPASGQDRGGGSGGAVKITAGEIDGLGTVSAIGGNGTNHGGGGGGGRVLLQFSSPNFSDNDFDLVDGVLIEGGISPNQNVRRFGGSGTYLRYFTTFLTTVLFLDNGDKFEVDDDLRIGRTPIEGNASYSSVIIRDGGNLDLLPTANISLTNALDWSDQGRVTDNGGTLAPFSSAGSLSIPTNSKLFANTLRTYTDVTVDGVLTHSNNSSTVAGQTEWVEIDATNITVNATGSIDAAARGYARANGTNLGTCAGGTCAGSGHGGTGGTGGDRSTIPGTIHDSITSPTQIGSGGANEFTTSEAGGGYINLDVTNILSVSGTISVDAADITATAHNAGGAAGGSINLTANSITGDGTISSNGGNTYAGGGGGGGRIAITGASNTFNGTLSAHGGSAVHASASDYFGGAGTIYTKLDSQTFGVLIIDNNNLDALDDSRVGKTPLTTPGNPASFTFNNVIVRNKGNLDLNADTTLNSNYNLDTAILTDNGGTWNQVVGAANIVIPQNGKIYANTSRTYNDYTVNGTLSHSKNVSTENYKINLIMNGDFTLSSTGSIDLDQLGYDATYGPGAGIDTGTQATGAGHGGTGGASSDVGSIGGVAYDTETAPMNIGSGGGQNFCCAGSGGGAVQLTVNGSSIILNGPISADATQSGVGTNSAGASGGAIWINGSANTTLSGSGLVSADGGPAHNSSSGAGAGGRIRFDCNGSTHTGDVTVNPGSIGIAAQAGTISYSGTCAAASPPTVDSVRIGTTQFGTNTAPLSLTADSTTTYYVNGQVSDPDGFANIQDVDARMYRSGVANGVACAADNNDCYIQTTCSLANGSGNTIDYSCQFDLQYYTDPTDNGMYGGETWNVRVSVSDDSNTVNDDAYTNEITSLKAISAPGNISYGTLALGQKSTTSAVLNVVNVGNINTDISLSGTTLTCPLGSIPPENNRYDLVDTDYDSMTNTLSGTTVVLDVDLPQRTSDILPSEDNIYWRIQIPSTGVVGSCTGMLSVIAE